MLFPFVQRYYMYIIETCRSPKHPALFVTANISGELGLWNLNHSMEEPLTPPVKVLIDPTAWQWQWLLCSFFFRTSPSRCQFKARYLYCCHVERILVRPHLISFSFSLSLMPVASRRHVNVNYHLKQVVDRCALTRMAWSPDGRRLCVGDAKVRVLCVSCQVEGRYRYSIIL